ncbi:MAG: ferrochelatase, partial [Conexivisphaerales archaeon]
LIVTMKSLTLVEFGAPSDKNELREFLRNLNGRDPDNSEIERALGKYMLSGGSPIRVKIQDLKVKLAGALDFPVDYAFLYNKPYLSDVIESKISSGFDNIVILPLFTFYSKRTAEDIEQCTKGAGNAKVEVLQLYKIGCLAKVWSNRLKSDIKGLENLIVIFIAHSIPAGKSEQYEMSFRKFAEQISASAGCKNFLIGYQNSRNGWLGPSIYDLKLGTVRNVVAVPLSFLLTNMEILYDLDVEYSRYLKQTGHTYIRSGPPEDELPACLASVV